MRKFFRTLLKYSVKPWVDAGSKAALKAAATNARSRAQEAEGKGLLEGARELAAFADFLDIAAEHVAL